MNMKELFKETIQTNLNKLVMSDPKKKTNEFQKIVVRRVLVKKTEQFQLELFTKQQIFIDVEKQVEQHSFSTQVVDSIIQDKMV